MHLFYFKFMMLQHLFYCITFRVYAEYICIFI